MSDDQHQPGADRRKGDDRPYPKFTPEKLREMLEDLEQMRREGVFTPESEHPQQRRGRPR
jgi:hypothetical protein